MNAKILRNRRRLENADPSVVSNVTVHRVITTQYSVTLDRRDVLDILVTHVRAMKNWPAGCDPVLQGDFGDIESITFTTHTEKGA